MLPRGRIRTFRLLFSTAHSDDVIVVCSNGAYATVHGRQGGASFRLEIALEAPKSAIFSAARAQGTGGTAPP